MKRWCFSVVAAALISQLLFGAGAVAKTTIRIGHKWDESHGFHIALSKAADLFEARYPDISVEIAAGWPDEKYKLAVATGDAPDVQMLTDIPTWGANGFIQPIDALMAKYSLKPQDFIPSVLNQNMWRGKLYALRPQVDANFGLVWNRTIFAESGLNPDVAPKTVREFDAYFKRLTQFNADGTAMRLGMTPWVLSGGNSNTVFTWGWLFGGDWWDYTTNKATAHHPGNVKALEYLTEYWQKYNDAFTYLGKGLPTGLSRFTAGREAMAFMTPGNYNQTRERLPDLDIAVTRMINNPEAGVENATWIGGWDLAITAGSKNPDAAFQFIKFITSDPDGVSTFCEYGSWMPSNIKVPYFRKLGSLPQWKVYTDTVVSAVKYRPAVPVFGSYNAQLGTLFPKIIRKEMTAQSAMEDLSKQIDAEMAEKYSK